MKKIFIFAAAAAMLASCSQDVLTDINSVSNDEGAISFSTWTNKTTRAENSSAEAKADLEKYHNTFAVYGYKNVLGVETNVFNRTVCTWDGAATDPFTANNDWVYTPLRYWDKSADNYDFYAFSPSTVNFQLVGGPGNYSFNLTGYSVDGKSLAQDNKVTGQFFDCFAATNENNADPMIATDVKGYTTYTTEHVQLDFNHILSRLNLAVRTTILSSGATVTLKKLMVYNMKAKGDFVEAWKSGEELKNGTAGRWATYAELVPFGYNGSTDCYISGAESANFVLTDAYNYVYQTLVIPQTLAVQTPFKVNGANVVGNGTDKPYLYIEYEIAYQGANGETETNFAYYNLASLFQNGYILDAEGHKAVVAAGPSSTDGKVYTDGTNFYAENGTTALTAIVYMGQDNNYYSDKACTTPATEADCNNAQAVIILDANKNAQYATRSGSDITFCEGWQNNLLITIDPVAIFFDASVFEWVTKENVDVTIQ